jgi:predicted transposase/invertase (TIGR01784 family)
MLLKRLVAAILGIAADSITEFIITNPEIPPESLGDKFCRLDINIIVNGQRVNIEVQATNEGDYPERSVYHTDALPSMAHRHVAIHGSRKREMGVLNPVRTF